jgi:hypothetical protein
MRVEAAPQKQPMRKKPCPYCGKKLQAPNKLKWHNNLARHLQNCAPYQRELISMCTRFIFEALTHFMQQAIGTDGSGYQKTANAKAEIEALERMYNSDGPEDSK